MFYIKQKVSNRDYGKNIKTIKSTNRMKNGIYKAHIDIAKVLKNASTITKDEGTVDDVWMSGFKAEIE